MKYIRVTTHVKISFLRSVEGSSGNQDNLLHEFVGKIARHLQEYRLLHNEGGLAKHALSCKFHSNKRITIQQAFTSSISEAIPEPVRSHHNEGDYVVDLSELIDKEEDQTQEIVTSKCRGASKRQSYTAAYRLNVLKQLANSKRLWN